MLNTITRARRQPANVEPINELYILEDSLVREFNWKYSHRFLGYGYPLFCSGVIPDLWNIYLSLFKSCKNILFYGPLGFQFRKVFPQFDEWHTEFVIMMYIRQFKKFHPIRFHGVSSCFSIFLYLCLFTLIFDMMSNSQRLSICTSRLDMNMISDFIINETNYTDRTLTIDGQPIFEFVYFNICGNLNQSLSESSQMQDIMAFLFQKIRKEKMKEAFFQTSSIFHEKLILSDPKLFFGEMRIHLMNIHFAEMCITYHIQNRRKDQASSIFLLSPFVKELYERCKNLIWMNDIRCRYYSFLNDLSHDQQSMEWYYRRKFFSRESIYSLKLRFIKFRRRLADYTLTRISTYNMEYCAFSAALLSKERIQEILREFPVLRKSFIFQSVLIARKLKFKECSCNLKVCLNQSFYKDLFVAYFIGV